MVFIYMVTRRHSGIHWKADSPKWAMQSSDWNITDCVWIVPGTIDCL